MWKNINSIIDDRLFLGNISAARSTRYLGERKITHILSVCTDSVPVEIQGSGWWHMRIPVEDVDYEDLLIHLPSACQFIEDALKNGSNILVHCGQGLSRSAAVVAAYLMWRRRLNMTDALEVVRGAREQIWPNPGFQEQLVLFELCQYSPSPSNGIYAKWRENINRHLRLEAEKRGLPQALS